MKRPSEFTERSEAALLGQALNGARQRFIEGGYPALGDFGCEQLGVRPVYTAERRPEFTDWRERLKTESGLVIANHPGGIDVPAILKALDREDVYFFAARKNMERLADVIGEDHLLKATTDPGELRAIFRRVEAVLARGGLVFLFPTAGSDFNGGPIEFKSGFRYLIKSLRPEQMVYAFQIDTDDLRAAFPRPPSGLALGSGVLAKKMGFRAHGGPRPTVRIDERYTRAQEWQAALQERPDLEPNTRLTQRYLELFHLDQQEKR